MQLWQIHFPLRMLRYWVFRAQCQKPKENFLCRTPSLFGCSLCLFTYFPTLDLCFQRKLSSPCWWILHALFAASSLQTEQLMQTKGWKSRPQGGPWSQHPWVCVRGEILVSSCSELQDYTFYPSIFLLLVPFSHSFMVFFQCSSSFIFPSPFLLSFSLPPFSYPHLHWDWAVFHTACRCWTHFCPILGWEWLSLWPMYSCAENPESEN